MEMIVIYDETGRIFYCAGGNVETPQGLPFIKVEVPDGKRLISVDVSGEIPTPVFEDLPQSEVDILKNKLELQDNAIMELAELISTLTEEV